MVISTGHNENQAAPSDSQVSQTGQANPQPGKETAQESKARGGSKWKSEMLFLGCITKIVNNLGSTWLLPTLAGHRRVPGSSVLAIPYKHRISNDSVASKLDPG